MLGTLLGQLGRHALELVALDSRQRREPIFARLKQPKVNNSHVSSIQPHTWNLDNGVRALKLAQEDSRPEEFNTTVVLRTDLIDRNVETPELTLTGVFGVHALAAVLERGFDDNFTNATWNLKLKQKLVVQGATMVLGLAGVPALKCVLEVSRPDVASTTAGFNQIPKNDPVELHRRMDHGHSGPHVHVHAELDSKPELDVEFVETMTTHNPKLVLQTSAADVFHGNNGGHAPYHAAWVSNNVSEPTFVQMANQLSPPQDHAMLDLELQASGPHSALARTNLGKKYNAVAEASPEHE